MNIALVVDDNLKCDRVFDPTAGRDNVLERFYLLRECLQSKGSICRTADMFDRSSIDVLIFQDIMNNLDTVLRTIKANPFVQLIYVPNEPSFVISLHDEKILPELPVDAVLTWNDRIAGKFSHVIKCNIGQPVITKEDIPCIPFSEKGFVCSIFSYKPSIAPGALFQERINVIDFFSKQPLGVELYGVGWKSAQFSFLEAIYKGPCDSKKEVQKKYKFSIAYENTDSFSGLITEKMFDCFAAGTVPIYLGAPNIEEYIPSSCFIDVRDFRGYVQLYKYLENMSESRYKEYLDKAKEYITTQEYYRFTSKQYVEIIDNQIKELSEKKRVVRTPVKLKWKLIKLIIGHLRVLRNWRQYRRMVFAMVMVW